MSRPKHSPSYWVLPVPLAGAVVMAWNIAADWGRADMWIGLVSMAVLSGVIAWDEACFRALKAADEKERGGRVDG